MRGVVAAGHPVTAGAGAEILRAGGNAVDAALAAMFTSFVAEPMLTGLGAGGYMLVAPPGSPPVLLDFFVEAPGRGLEPGAPHAPLLRRRRRLRRRGPGVQHRRQRGGPLRHAVGRRGPRPSASPGCRSPSSSRPPRPPPATASRSTSSRRTCSRSSRRSPPRRRRRARCSCPRGARRWSATCTGTPRWPTRSSGSPPKGRRRSTPATSPRRCATGSPSAAGC